MQSSNYLGTPYVSMQGVLLTMSDLKLAIWSLQVIDGMNANATGSNSISHDTNPSTNFFAS